MELRVSKDGYLIDGNLVSFQSIRQIGVSGDFACIKGDRYLIFLSHNEITNLSFANTAALVDWLLKRFAGSQVGYSPLTDLVTKSGYFTYPQLANSAQNSSTYTVSANNISAFPFYLSENQEFNQFAIRCLHDTPAGNVAVAIYRAGDKGTTGDRLVPHEILTVIEGSSEIPFRASFVKANASLILSFLNSIVIPAGLYFLAFNANVNTNIRGAVSANIKSAYGAGLTAFADGQINRFISSTTVPYNVTNFGLPDICPILTNKSNNSIIPFFGIRKI